MNKYDFKLDLKSDNSLSIIAAMINKGKKILEFGPANGRLTKYLTEVLECTVDIVEIDYESGKEAASFARHSCIGDYEGNIENFTWLDKLGDERYDYIICADVLEHLHNPSRVIDEVRKLLCDDGKIITSIPNVAHNTLIYNLLNNEFSYNKIGLLDDTHIHLFSYKSAIKLFEDNNMVIVNQTATYKTNIDDEFPLSLYNASDDEIEILNKHSYGDVYQFIFMAMNKEYYERNENSIEVNNNINEFLNDSISSVYVDSGDGYLEENRIRTDVINGNNVLKYNLSKFSIIKNIRIDFIEKSKCIIKLNKIIINKKNVVNTNFLGNYLDKLEEEYFFDTLDPYIILSEIPEKIDELEIDFDLIKINSLHLLRRYIDLKNKIYLDREMKHKENEKNNISYIKKLKGNLTALEEKNSELINELENNKHIYDTELKLQKDNFGSTIDDLNNKLTVKNQQIAIRDNQYNAIINSTCWKITKPLRYIVVNSKKLLASNKVTYLFCKGLHSIKQNGLKSTISRVKYYCKFKLFTKLHKINVNDDYNNSLTSIKRDDIKSLESFNKLIAVHLHLYYVDLLEEFVSYLNNIPFTFDLYVSCKPDSDINKINDRLSKIINVNKVDVRESINRGRDIAPLYVQFAKDIVKYEYFLHIHSKKSLFSGQEQYGWRQYALDCLLGDKDIVNKIFSLFTSEYNIGLFFPETYGDMHLIAHDWLANRENGKRLLESMGIEFEEGLFNYPVGSFFWAKTEALRPLFERKLKYDDFPEEAGQTDGTIAHALERVLPFVVKKQGYQIAIHDYELKNIYFERSLKIYQEYFSLTADAVQYHLSQFELVSFDIFDTLITRKVYEPDDLFKLMETKIEKKYGIQMDFLDLRKKAETMAWAKKKEHTTIHDIYDYLPSVSNISYDMALQIKEMEISTEIDVCMPRKDMLKVFNHVKQNKRKIVLVSDMYLTSDIIRKILEKCGYEGYDDLWVSCEKGLRKDNDTLWPVFFNEYGKYNTIHVGDNPRSDIQLVGDKLRRTFYVMNPRVAFKLSKHYSLYNKYINTSIENSLYMGMIINGGLYNSPFSQKSNGEPILSDNKQFGYVGLGPLFTSFVVWLNKNHTNDIQYLFLAREGYLLKMLYETYCNEMKKDNSDSIYFLTSRRAVSVAAINDEKDIREILTQYYKGTCTNLIDARLGYKLPIEFNDQMVQMPNDIDVVMDMLSPYINDIIIQANKEKDMYKKYIENVVNTNYHSVVIDVGYSGTIQYYLTKLMNKKIDGNYLCTWIDKKPERLGCKCDALFPVNNPNEEFSSKIFSNQLLLEAVLQAPFGQLLSFELKDKNIHPIYKDDNIVPDFVTELQMGINEFVKEYAEIMFNIKDMPDESSNLAADIFNIFSLGDTFTSEMCKNLSVQDDYCSNGTQRFDINDKSWKVE